MSPSQILTTAFFACLILQCAIARYGENCITPKDERGKCVPIKSCDGVYELLQNIQRYGEENFKDEVEFLQQSSCKSDDETPLICCPKENIQINPDVYDHLKNLNCGGSGSSRVARDLFQLDTGLYDFRWLALLKYDGKEPFACGGSLIDDRHVLTAAHCLRNFENLPIAVRLGEYDLNNETDCKQYGKRLKCLDPVQEIPIEKYIVHEDYNYTEILYHDVAILRLAKPVNLETRSVRTICLPITKELRSDIPDEFLVAGWGRTQRENRSSILQWSAIPNQMNKHCEESFGLRLSVQHICAGGRRLQDTCKGDAGGPIFYPHAYVDGVVRAIQYGIVYLGALPCGSINVPAVYLNLAHYMQWITDHIVIQDV